MVQMPRGGEMRDTWGPGRKQRRETFTLDSSWDDHKNVGVGEQGLEECRQTP